jgi:hypothetical protein
MLHTLNVELIGRLCKVTYCYNRSAGLPTSSRILSPTNSRIFSQLLRLPNESTSDLPALEFSRRAYKLVRLASGSPRLDDAASPGTSL